MIVEGFVLGLIAAVTFGAADFVAAIVARRIGISRLMLVTHVAAVAVASPYFLLATGLEGIPLGYLPLFAAMGLLLLTILAAFYKGLQIGPVALVSPTVSAHVVIVVLLSVFALGERLGELQMAGMLAAVVGVMLASVTVENTTSSGRSGDNGLLFALIATVGAGFFVFSVGAVSKEIGWFVAVYLLRVITLLLIVAVQRGSHSLSYRTVPFRHLAVAALVGVLQLAGLSSYAYGAQVGQISVVAATFSVYPIIPVLGGLLVFRERLVRRQALGLASVFTGLLILGVTG